MKKIKLKKLIKSAKSATIVLNQPVYTKDKSRFFKDSYLDTEGRTHK